MKNIPNLNIMAEGARAVEYSDTGTGNMTWELYSSLFITHALKCPLQTRQHRHEGDNPPNPRYEELHSRKTHTHRHTRISREWEKEGRENRFHYWADYFELSCVEIIFKGQRNDHRGSIVLSSGRFVLKGKVEMGDSSEISIWKKTLKKREMVLRNEFLSGR